MSYRGITADNDVRFTNAEKKLLQSTKFPPEFSQKVDMTKVNLQVIKPWVAKRITELLKFEDEVVVELVYSMLEPRFPEAKKCQLSLTGFLDKSAAVFMKELWTMLISAQESIGGIPAKLVEEKKEEIKRRRLEDSSIGRTIQGRGEGRSRPHNDAENVQQSFDDFERPRRMRQEGFDQATVGRFTRRDEVDNFGRRRRQSLSPVGPRRAVRPEANYRPSSTATRRDAREDLSGASGSRGERGSPEHHRNVDLKREHKRPASRSRSRSREITPRMSRVKSEPRESPEPFRDSAWKNNERPRPRSPARSRSRSRSPDRDVNRSSRRRSSRDRGSRRERSRDRRSGRDHRSRRDSRDRRHRSRDRHDSRDRGTRDRTHRRRSRSRSYSRERRSRRPHRSRRDDRSADRGDRRRRRSYSRSVSRERTRRERSSRARSTTPPVAEESSGAAESHDGKAVEIALRAKLLRQKLLAGSKDKSEEVSVDRSESRSADRSRDRSEERSRDELRGHSSRDRSRDKSGDHDNERASDEEPHGS